MFELAEKINRGSAYYGAKSKGLSKGMSEQAAIEYAKDIVRKTQFTFGSIDTPPVLASDLVKTLAQFQSFTLKQAEFLGGKVKQKDILGIIRYIGATLVFAQTAGKLIGYDLKDAIPSFRMETPLSNGINTASGVVDLFSSDEEKRKAAPAKILKNAPILFPAGVQIKKTVTGLTDASRGYSATPTGRIRFPVEQTLGNTLRAGAFGTNNLPEAQAYYDEKKATARRSTVSDVQRAGQFQELYQ
jgi:hypothetical protein